MVILIIMAVMANTMAGRARTKRQYATLRHWGLRR